MDILQSIAGGPCLILIPAQQSLHSPVALKLRFVDPVVAIKYLRGGCLGLAPWRFSCLDTRWGPGGSHWDDNYFTNFSSRERQHHVEILVYITVFFSFIFTITHSLSWMILDYDSTVWQKEYFLSPLPTCGIEKTALTFTVLASLPASQKIMLYFIEQTDQYGIISSFRQVTQRSKLTSVSLSGWS